MTPSAVRIRRSAWQVAAVVMATVSVLAFISDIFLVVSHPGVRFAIADAIALGVLSGTIAWIYQRRQNRYLAERLEVISEMNHHVRNGLQVIQYSAYLTKDKEHIQRIEESLRRIEWALREVLTGKRAQSNGPEEKE